MHFGIKSVAEVVAERRNVVQEKYTGRGASSRRFVYKIGEMTFFLWAVQHSSTKQQQYDSYSNSLGRILTRPWNRKERNEAVHGRSFRS